MRLEAALTEFSYAKDHTPTSRRWYHSRLTAFTTWVQDQGITDIDDLTAPLIRRYVEQRRIEVSATGRPLSSHTLHGHVRAIKVLLNWAVSEDLLER